LFNEPHPNPFYLVTCNNPKVEKKVVERSFCNKCKVAKEPDFDENSSLKELVGELEGHKKEMVKKYVLDVLNGEIQSWEV